MKEPLLLLHGAISSRKQFEALSPYLQDRFKIYAIDFPGHGGREIPEAFSIPVFAQSVLEFLVSKKLSEVSIFGYSMGGYVALYLAAHYPERIKKVFTLATKLEWTEAIAESETAQLNPEKILEKVPAFAAMLREIHSPQDWKMAIQKTSAMLLALGRSPALTEREFRQIKIPVTIAIGELDKMVSINESKHAVSLLQNGRLLKLTSTPHPFEKVSHEMLAGHIKKFFTSPLSSPLL